MDKSVVSIRCDVDSHPSFVRDVQKEISLRPQGVLLTPAFLDAFVRKLIGAGPLIKSDLENRASEFYVEQYAVPLSDGTYVFTSAPENRQIMRDMADAVMLVCQRYDALQKAKETRKGIVGGLKEPTLSHNHGSDELAGRVHERKSKIVDRGQVGAKSRERIAALVSKKTERLPVSPPCLAPVCYSPLE